MQPLPIVWHPSYEVDIGPHVFPTAKFRLIRERLLGDRTVDERDIQTPKPADDADVRLVHSTAYVEKINVVNAFKKMGVAKNARIHFQEAV